MIENSNKCDNRVKNLTGLIHRDFVEKDHEKMICQKKEKRKEIHLKINNALLLDFAA
jgi:hypothetical protein